MALFDRQADDHQRETYSRGQPFISGETVTPGRYRCGACDHEYVVPKGRVKSLPVCPRCQHEHWKLAG